MCLLVQYGLKLLNKMAQGSPQQFLEEILGPFNFFLDIKLKELNSFRSTQKKMAQGRVELPTSAL
jgi:hypothetical protein